MDIKRYEEVKKDVDDRLGEMVEEISGAIGVLRKDQQFVRVRALVAFSFLEIASNLYNAFYNRSLGGRPLLEEWMKKYCVIESNATYKTHPYLKLVNEKSLYKFRCAIVHAFGLPEPENGVSINMPNGSESTDVIRDWDEKFKKLGHTVAFISPDTLIKLFIDGFTLMHADVFKDASVATQADLDGLERISKEFARRGARIMPI